MAAWRNLAILVTFLTSVRAGFAQTYSLKEDLQAGACCHIQLAMKLTGEWHVQREDATVPMKLSANAEHDYRERVLTLGANGLPEKAARYYHAATATIAVAGRQSERGLRPERRLIVAQRCKDDCFSYCPEGTLTREELETLEHFDTLNLTGILPGKAVAVGATWKLSNAIVHGLCSFDGLVEQTITCKLLSVQKDEATIGITGSASGINVGAQAKLTVDAIATYDLKAQRLTALDWKQKDVRDQGPASPATTLEVSYSLKRALLDDEPKEVSDVALIKAPEGTEPPPASFLQLVHLDPKNRYQLTHGREWRVAGQADEHLILRLMDRGDWVAQATLTPWTSAEPGKHMAPDDFKDMVADTPGWEADEIREDGALESIKGYWIYRVVALGEMDGMKVLQNFYIVAGPNGQQVVLSVTLRAALAEKLGTRDLKLVDGIELPGQ